MTLFTSYEPTGSFLPKPHGLARQGGMGKVQTKGLSGFFRSGNRPCADIRQYLHSITAPGQFSGRSANGRLSGKRVSFCLKERWPASGNRNSGASPNNVGSNGNWWSACANSDNNGHYLNFNSGNVNPQNDNNRYYGYSVRPALVVVPCAALFREPVSFV